MFGPLKKQPRLGQWNGRRRSSRHDEPVLPHLWRRPVLLRLATVLVTAAAVTGLIYSCGPLLPYRVGEVYPRDVRVRVYFDVINQAQTERRREEAVEQSGGDPVVREAARLAVPPVVDQYPVGVPLVRAGQPITPRQLGLLMEEHRAYLRNLSRADHVRRGVALFLVISLLASLIAFYSVRFQPGLAQSLPKIAGVCAMVLLTLTLSVLLSRPPWYAVLIPLTITAMILTIAYNPQFALLMSFSLSLAVCVALGTDLNYLLIMMGGLATAVLSLRNVRTRTRLAEVGGAAGAAFLAMTLATGLLTGQTWSMIAWDSGRHFACPLLSAALGSSPTLACWSWPTAAIRCCRN
jgi:membrane-associated HD superfamily phosphohydrolase